MTFDLNKSILEVDEQVKAGLVDTETLFKTLEFYCHLAGAEANENPQRYESLIKQLEILSVVTPYLDKDYWEKKSNLKKTFDEQKSKLEKQNPTKSKLQNRFQNKLLEIQTKINEIYVQYLWEWHTLLLTKTKAKYQQQYRTHVIGGKNEPKK